MADTSARMAWAADAPSIAAVQVAAWRAKYAGVLPAAYLAGLDPEVFAAGWQRSLAAPAEARNRVLVALDHDRVVGFAITSPADDPDADPATDGAVEEFTLDPEEVRRGHGSRLLQACVDTLVADRFTRATCWVGTTDDALRAFLESAGWAADGATRELEADSGERVRQVRLHSAI